MQQVIINRLNGLTKNGKIISEYAYDPEGFRVVKKAKGQTIHYVFQGTEPIFEKNITTGKVKSYVYALGKHLARVDGRIGDTGAKKYWYVTDHLGSIRAVTDKDGKKVWSADYLAFGKQYTKDGDFEELHSFTGKEYDPDTGLHYYNARWYDADLGRFISEDPVADPNNPNLYSYGRNNPLRFLDPTGYWTDEDNDTHFGGGSSGGWHYADGSVGTDNKSTDSSRLSDDSSDNSDSGSDSDSGETDNEKQTEIEQTTTKQSDVGKNYSELSVPELLIEAALLGEKLANLQEKAERALNDPNATSAELQNLANQLEATNKQASDLVDAFKGRESEVRDEIAKYAASLANSKYVKGGNEKGKIDCSGTVYYSFNMAGVNLADMTAKGYHDMMTVIDKSELRPGDIITYSNSKGEITHVQVYIGEAVDRNGNLVHDAVINAGSERTGVYVISLNEYNSWSEIKDNLTPHYGNLLGVVK